MEFTIRPVRPGDAQGVNELRRMPGVFETMLGIPSERVEDSEKYLLSLDKSSHQFAAVVQDDRDGEKLIGLAGLTLFPSPRLRHSASVGIMVHRDYQDCGVGTALMKTLLDLADNWLMLVRVELCVFSDNTRAIHLYESLGFEKEGLKRKAAIRGGAYADEYLMARIRPAAL